jgi:hypothetical protein
MSYDLQRMMNRLLDVLKENKDADEAIEMIEALQEVLIKFWHHLPKRDKLRFLSQMKSCTERMTERLEALPEEEER